ncbi:hypothetical protein Tco_1024283, partial [Tanacetum coccineum]
YPEYLVPSDDEVPIEDQPLPADASPIALLAGYVSNFDPLEEDPKENFEEYPADRGDDDDDDEEEEEDEEHLAPADSTTLPTVDPVPSAEDTKAFETNESAPTPPVPSPRLRRARISSSHDSVESCITIHPPSIRDTITTLLLPSTTRRDDLPKADMPLQKRDHFTAPTGRFEVGESSSAAAARQTGHTLPHRVDYGFIDTMDASIRASESRAMIAVREVNKRVTDPAITQRQETHELQVRCEDTQDDRALLRAQAMEAQIKALHRDVDVLQRQRIRDEDRLTSHIQHEHDMFKELVRTAEVRPQDGPVDAGSSY